MSRKKRAKRWGRCARRGKAVAPTEKSVEFIEGSRKRKVGKNGQRGVPFAE